MIFYFTGTGNSLWVARELDRVFGEGLTNIADVLNGSPGDLDYTLSECEKIFFVFPVHSWGPAVLMLDFIWKMNFSGYTGQPVYAVCTCGDNCGYTSRIMAKALGRQAIALSATYSIQMPNNYILMKGFGVDSKEVEAEKLRRAPLLVQAIADGIRTGSGQVHYTVGSWPFLKSRIVYPLFSKFALGHNSFYAKESCISCGLCVEVCPVKTVSLTKALPEWGKKCVQCTACINRCPVRAIEYGKITEGQGRYHHPAL